MLHGDHDDMLHRVLGHVSRAVQMNNRRLTRLDVMATLVRVLASHAPASAKDAVEQLLYACTIEIDQGKDNVCDMSMTTVPVALRTVAMDISASADCSGRIGGVRCSGRYLEGFPYYGCLNNGLL